MNRLIAFTIILVFSFTHSFSQSSSPEENAKNHIQSLKKGMLLVRLHGNQKKIAALKEVGFHLHAITADDEQRDRNKKIIQAFHKHYKFSKVYFFYANNTKEVTAGEFENVLFEDTLFELKTFDLSKEDTYILDSRHAYFEDKKKGKNGYLILQLDLQPLSKPFPYRVKGKTLFARRTLDQMVILLNEKFTAFYES